jgi:hypothetical protein
MEFAKLLGAKAFFGYFIPLPVIKIVKFSENLQPHRHRVLAKTTPTNSDFH